MKSLQRRLRALFHGLTRRAERRVFLYLAALFTVVALADAVTFNLIAGMKQATFDMMLRHRLRTPRPDPRIVIVDIDEASLAAMAPEYGRWPWPRQVLGEFIEKLSAQQPRAIVLDILFSDPDVFNPDSDAYFNEVIERTPHLYFPVLRLPPEADALSELRFSRVPGAVKTPQAQEDARVALVLPHFPAAQAGTRLGTHNIYPDKDGIARQYPLAVEKDGWLLPSLPARVAEALGQPVPRQPGILLNWRGPEFTYPHVSFASVYQDSLREHPERPQDEFAGKIVLIGATAASLFDIKATPVSQQHPGVEVLATALDNLLHDDYLRVPQARFAYLGVALLILWVTAFAFFREWQLAHLDRLFGASQAILIGLSYASINLTHTYINLTGPVTFALAYFTIARIYAFASARVLDRSVVLRGEVAAGAPRGVMLLLEFPGEGHDDKALRKLARRLAQASPRERSVEQVEGHQRGMWRLFEPMLCVCWLARDEREEQSVREEATALVQQVPAWARELGLEAAPRHVVVGAGLRGGADTAATWRALFAHGVLQLEALNEKQVGAVDVGTPGTAGAGR